MNQHPAILDTQNYEVEPINEMVRSTNQVTHIALGLLPAAWVPPGLVMDVADDFDQVQTAICQLAARGTGHDMSLRLATVVHSTGKTTAEALRGVTDFFRESPQAELQPITWSRSPGHRVDVWKYTATLTGSSPDERGEYGRPPAPQPGPVRR